MSKRRQRIGIALGGILVIGLLCYAIIFFWVNKNLNPSQISMNQLLVEQRLNLRLLAERIYGTCIAIYIIGLIVFSYSWARHSDQMAIGTIIVYFVSQITLAALCILPFALLDRPFFWDYVFPLRSLIPTLLIVAALLCFVWMYQAKKRRYR